MGSKLILRSSLAVFCLVLIGGLIGCSNDAGPNDPGMTSADIQKVRAAAVKPSDGTGPGGGKTAPKPK